MTNVLPYEKIQKQITALEKKALKGEDLAKEFYKYIYNGFYKFTKQIALSSDKKDSEGYEKKVMSMGISAETSKKISKYMADPNLNEKQRYDKIAKDLLPELLKQETDPVKKEKIGLEIFRAAIGPKTANMETFRKNKSVHDKIIAGTITYK
jgi:hypothetical protein